MLLEASSVNLPDTFRATPCCCIYSGRVMIALIFEVLLAYVPVLCVAAAPYSCSACCQSSQWTERALFSWAPPAVRSTACFTTTCIFGVCTDLLASGGQGAVYKCYQNDGTQVAVKVFHPTGSRSAQREISAVSSFAPHFSVRANASAG